MRCVDPLATACFLVVRRCAAKRCGKVLSQKRPPRSLRKAKGGSQILNGDPCSASIEGPSFWDPGSSSGFM